MFQKYFYFSLYRTFGTKCPDFVSTKIRFKRDDNIINMPRFVCFINWQLSKLSGSLFKEGDFIVLAKLPVPGKFFTCSTKTILFSDLDIFFQQRLSSLESTWLSQIVQFLFT